FDRRNQVGFFCRPRLGHQLDHLGKDLLVGEHGSDVPKDDSFLRVVRDISYVLLQVFRRGHRTDRKYSSVRRSPSSRPPSGCQPSLVRARVMSGWRRVGSSTGKGPCTISLFAPASLMIVSASCSMVTSCGLPRLTGISSPFSRLARMPRT